MKINWNDKYTTISVYCLIVVAITILMCVSFVNEDIIVKSVKDIFYIIKPFIIGGVIAYLLNFILNFFENRVLKGFFKIELSANKVRALGLVLTYITAFFACFVFIKIIFPQLIESISGLVDNIPTYIANATSKLTEIFGELNLSDDSAVLLLNRWNEIVDALLKIATSAMPAIATIIFSLISSILNIVLGIIVSIYILIEKDRFAAIFKKVVHSLFSIDNVEKILYWFKRSNDIFNGFIGGKILDSTIIGLLTLVVLLVFKMPYAPLVAFIVFVTNIVPFFGPFIGAIPSFIIILFVSPPKAFLFLLIILIIQQIDGNIIGPYILGDSIGVSAFWILFSVIVFSKFLGVVGMIIGVPIFAILYSIIKELVESTLLKKGLPCETSEYLSINNDNKM